MDPRISRMLTTAVLVAAAVLIVLVLADHFGGQPQESEPVPGQENPAGPADVSIHLLLGNPSGATDNPADADDFLMRKPYYALSYNNETGTPNWVSWQVKKSDLGDAPRPEFYPDPDLPRRFKHVVPRDYSGSGFDRGHMCPHSDRGATEESSKATFAMTNMVPQAPSLNQKAWADLEEYCRDLVRKRDRVLYIVAGPQGRGGDGKQGPADSIANGKITVPAKCWKVVVVIDDGTGGPDDLARINPRTRVIAVMMPNQESVTHGWAKFRTSVRDVESSTGYRFFDRVPAQIADELKERTDTEHVPPSRPRRSGG